MMLPELSKESYGFNRGSMSREGEQATLQALQTFIAKKSIVI